MTPFITFALPLAVGLFSIMPAGGSSVLKVWDQTREKLRECEF